MATDKNKVSANGKPKDDMVLGFDAPKTGFVCRTTCPFKTYKTGSNKLMKGKALRKHNLHEKTANVIKV